MMVELSRVRVTGPLSSYAEGFGAALVGVGYTPRTARDQVYVLAHLSRWLSDEGFEAVDLTPQLLERFLVTRRRFGYQRWLTARSLRPLVDFLRHVGAMPAVEQPTLEGPVERLLGSYRRYLTVERRLAPATVRIDVDVARRFLMERAGGGDLGLAGLVPSDVTGFVLGESRRYSPGSMKVHTTALRSLLRFLFVTDVTHKDLTGAVPAVAGWCMTSLPKDVEECVVAALLDSCDRTTAVGRRDFAVLTVLVRLGLRAGEVAALCLDDVDWEAGELVVRGKGNRLDRLPLPHDVGDALVDYLRHGRPHSDCRALFLRAFAPSGPMSAKAVVMVPRNASGRAGIAAVGAHRLRHTAATRMLRQGASLAEVAEILRHRSESTTQIYAKVDRAALDLVVRPWPGAER